MEPKNSIGKESAIALYNSESDSSRKTDCNPKMTHFTQENLDRLWNALEYTRATISPGNRFQSKENPDWVEIHKGRAHQSNSYLNQAIKLVNQMKEEIAVQSK